MRDPSVSILYTGRWLGEHASSSFIDNHVANLVAPNGNASVFVCANNDDLECSAEGDMAFLRDARAAWKGHLSGARWLGGGLGTSWTEIVNVTTHAMLRAVSDVPQAQDEVNSFRVCQMAGFRLQFAKVGMCKLHRRGHSDELAAADIVIHARLDLHLTNPIHVDRAMWRQMQRHGPFVIGASPLNEARRAANGTEPSTPTPKLTPGVPLDGNYGRDRQGPSTKDWILVGEPSDMLGIGAPDAVRFDPNFRCKAFCPEEQLVAHFAQRQPNPRPVQILDVPNGGVGALVAGRTQDFHSDKTKFARTTRTWTGFTDIWRAQLPGCSTFPKGINTWGSTCQRSGAAEAAVRQHTQQEVVEWAPRRLPLYGMVQLVGMHTKAESVLNGGKGVLLGNAAVMDATGVDTGRMRVRIQEPGSQAGRVWLLRPSNLRVLPSNASLSVSAVRART